MAEQVNPLAFCNLLQQTLRSLCQLHGNSNWVYAVYWRILPRNYPPPKWDDQGGPAFRRCRGNRRNWILVWEDGFCNFGATANVQCEIDTDSHLELSTYRNSNDHYPKTLAPKTLAPELFFKLSHEIYSFGESLIGKVAADQSHRWVFLGARDDQDISLLPPWKNAADIHPRTWEAQFESGIKTIALIAVREGVVQLGAVKQVMEDLNYVVQLRKKFSYLECIPGFLLPHPSSLSLIPIKTEEDYNDNNNNSNMSVYCWPNNIIDSSSVGNIGPSELVQGNFVPLSITPSMSSLESFLSKLPSVLPASSPSTSDPSCLRPVDSMGGSLGVHDKDNMQEDDERGGVEAMGGQWASTWV